MSQISTKSSQEIARPPSVLAPLIQEKLDEGDRAGMEYYKAAGEMLNEAEASFERLADFYDWAEKKFGKSRTAIRTYMSLGALQNPPKFKSLAAFHRHQGKQAREHGRVYRDWTAPVDSIAQRARHEAASAEAYRIAHETRVSSMQARNQEREAEKKLALRLIDIGYKVLARELHPDKGGSRDAMARLNSVRNRLRECA